MKYLTLFISLSLLLGLGSCKKTYYCDEPLECDGELMRLEDYTGLDGCGFVFVKDNQAYEPTNLHLMDVALEEGELYYVTYDTVAGASICMVGPLIEIGCIERFVLRPHND